MASVHARRDAIDKNLFAARWESGEKVPREEHEAVFGERERQSGWLQAYGNCTSDSDERYDEIHTDGVYDPDGD